MELRVYIVMLACMAALISRAQAIQPDARFTPDKYLFKGRLVGVSFPPNVQSQEEIAIHFTIDESYAVPFIAEPRRVVAVRTTWPAHFDEIDRDNYVAAIEALFPQDLRLGERYLVVANHPEARGLELISFEAATDDNQLRFVAHHRDYIQRFQRYRHNAVLRANIMKLRTVKQYVERLRHDYKAEGRIDPQWEEIIQQKQQELDQHRDFCIRMFEGFLDSLREQRAITNDLLDTDTIELMIQDTERELAVVREFDLRTDE